MNLYILGPDKRRFNDIERCAHRSHHSCSMALKMVFHAQFIYSLCGFLHAIYTDILRHPFVVSYHELASLGLNPANIILCGTVRFASQVQ